jgi:hypothetical protein
MRVMSRFKIFSLALVLVCGSAAPLCAESEAVALPLPQGVNALQPKMAARMRELIKEAEKWRGLKTSQAVPAGSLDEAMLRKKMLEGFAKELPREKMLPLEESLKVFGFIPGDMNLGKYYPELLTSQVGGYYDPDEKYLVLVQREGGLLGAAAKQKLGAALAERMEETVMVHELTHALQDQNFDLKTFNKSEPLSDEGVARLALIEGDATLTMYNFVARMRLEDFPGLDQMMQRMLKDPKELIAMSPDMPGAAEMTSAPAWFRDNLLFSYLQGYVFCFSVRKLGGQPLLDYAFTKDPPRSSEQILHPEKWHTKRDDPVVIEFPDLSGVLPKYRKIAEGQLGEASVGILLRDRQIDGERAEKAAAGWGGDKFALYAKGGDRALVWITEWDTEADAREFKAAVAEARKDWLVETSGPRRVSIIGGALEKVNLLPLKEKLANAKALPGENKNIDLAALKVKAKPAAAAAVEKVEEGDVDALLDNPELWEKLQENLGDKNLEGVDLGEMLKNPGMRKMIKQSLTKKPSKTTVSADGRTYTNETGGYSIQAPESAKDWTLDPKPPIPLAVVAIYSPDRGTQVQIVNQTMPMAVTLDMLAPMLEMGPKMAVKNYKKISAGRIKTSGKDGYALQYEGDQAGRKIRSIMQVYISGTDMLMVMAMGSAAHWDEQEKIIKETLGSFKFLEPQEKKEK